MPYPVASLRGDLDAIVLKAMRVEPAARYGSADELALDVGRVLNGDPVTARPPSLGYLTGRLVRRHRVAAAVAGLAVVSVVAALVVAVVQYRRAAAAQTVAEARFADVRALANGMIFRLDEAVRTKSPIEARQVIVSDALQYLDKLAATSPDATLQLELAQGYRRIAEIQGSGNTANLGDRDGALASVRKSAAILDTLVTSQDERERVLESRVATYRLLSSLVPETERVIVAKSALAAAEQRAALNRSDAARVALAAAHFSLAAVVEGAEKRANFEAAGREFEALLAEQPDDPARMRNVALVDKYLVGMSSRLEPDMVRRGERAAALDSRRLALDPENRQTMLDAAISFSQLAFLKTNERDRLPLYERSLAIREQVAARDPADDFARVLLRRAVAQVGSSQFRLGHREAARASARRTLALFEGAAMDAGQQRWRGWGHLILAGDARDAGACGHLRQAVIDLRTSEYEYAEAKADLERVRSRLTGCVVDDDAVVPG